MENGKRRVFIQRGGSEEEVRVGQVRVRARERMCSGKLETRLEGWPKAKGCNGRSRSRSDGIFDMTCKSDTLGHVEHFNLATVI